MRKYVAVAVVAAALTAGQAVAAESDALGAQDQRKSDDNSTSALDVELAIAMALIAGGIYALSTTFGSGEKPASP
jgi:ribosomal protein L1